MEKLVLQCNLAPGDLLMLSAAVRDLHRAYPGVFLTDVRTRFAELWENNPYITPIDPRESSVEFIDCLYPLIQSSNHIPCHFLEGMVDFLNQQLHLRVQLTEFRGDIHLSEEELTARSPVGELFGHEGPYWIIAAGGKQDYTIKWWDHKRYQRVVDHFRGRIQFVQVGAVGHYHPELEGVLDMRARTTLRQLVRLMLHAEGVLCPVTLFMHLAAAVPARRPHRLRPCVVIAGGREPPHWEAYPGHQFIHTVGLLPCCRIGGCWRARARPLRDKSHLSQPEHLCVDVVGGLPRCMDLIRAEDVIRRIEMCVEAEAQFTRLIQEEKRKLGDWREASLAGMICIDSTPRRSASNPNGSIDERDLILNHYRQQAPSNKRPLTADLSGHAMTNTPRGLGDTLLLTPLPAVAASQGTVRYIASESGFFEPLMRFNPDYRPAGDRPRVAANVLQLRHDLGNGHFVQRLQRAMGLEPELLPRAHVQIERRVQPGRTALHFEAGSPHLAWQRIFVHPRARQLYPESRRIVEAFIEAHPEMSFLEVGRTASGLAGVEDCTGLPLERTIELLSQCEYFIGIVSGPMHLATALGVKCVVLVNFPPAAEIILPVLKDIDLIESEWLYPQNVHLHQENEGPLVKRLTLDNLERATNGELYPYWSHDYLSLIWEVL